MTPSLVLVYGGGSRWGCCASLFVLYPVVWMRTALLHWLIAVLSKPLNMNIVECAAAMDS